VFIKSNVVGQSLIFGSAIALESGVYSKHDMFAPYAFHVDDKIVSFDPSFYFNYDDEETKWYHVPKAADRTRVSEIDTTNKHLILAQWQIQILMIDQLRCSLQDRKIWLRLLANRVNRYVVGLLRLGNSR
jgi:hypothetical protein